MCVHRALNVSTGVALLGEKLLLALCIVVFVGDVSLQLNILLLLRTIMMIWLIGLTPYVSVVRIIRTIQCSILVVRTKTARQYWSTMVVVVGGGDKVELRSSG